MNKTKRFFARGLCSDLLMSVHLFGWWKCTKKEVGLKDCADVLANQGLLSMDRKIIDLCDSFTSYLPGYRYKDLYNSIIRQVTSPAYSVKGRLDILRVLLLVSSPENLCSFTLKQHAMANGLKADELGRTVAIKAKSYETLQNKGMVESMYNTRLEIHLPTNPEEIKEGRALLVFEEERGLGVEKHEEPISFFHSTVLAAVRFKKDFKEFSHSDRVLYSEGKTRKTVRSLKTDESSVTTSACRCSNICPMHSCFQTYTIQVINNGLTFHAHIFVNRLS